MQREKGEISVARGPNCNSLWRSIGSGCYWAWTENASVYKKVSAHHSSLSCRRQLSHWAVHCLCCRIWCQTTSDWKLYFCRLALTFIDQKKDYRPDSSSFHATAAPQKLMELHQHTPGMGLAQQSGSAGVSARQLLGKKSSCREFPPCEQQQSFWEPENRIFERERFSSVGSISPVWALHMDIPYRKNFLAGHWFTLDPDIASMQLPLHFGDVVVSSNGMFWKSFSVLLFMLTFWIIKLSTLKSGLLWTSVRIDQMTSRGPFQLRVFPEFKIQRLFTSGGAYSAKTCSKPDSSQALPFVTLFY